MWVVDWLPSWFFYATFLIGVAGLVATFFIGLLPFFKQYVLPARIAFTAILIGSTWFLGAASNEEKWQQRIKELEAKILVAEAKSKEENVKIVTKVVTKTKVIREKAKERVTYIDREIVKYDNKCEIPNEFIKVLNEAAESPK